MASLFNGNNGQEWRPYEKAIFRFAFVYFVIQAVPLDWKYFYNLISINWLKLGFNDLFNISRYTPQLLGQETTPDFWGLNTLGDWAIIALLSVAIAALWHWWEKRKPLRFSYDDLYYALRVILRYRLALGVIAYGLIKVFPLQAPYPSLSNLNTDYGDLSAWKIFALSLGVAPTFETFLGSLELLGGLLLLWRRTTAIGAFLIVIFYGNVVLSNLAYEGNETIYGLYLLHIAGFLLLYDAQRIINVFSLNRPGQPDTYRPVFAHAWQRNLRTGLKAFFVVLFVGVFGIQTYRAYSERPYHYPEANGLPDAAGIYNVQEFVWNGQARPYAKDDTVRWQDVVFETWSTLSVKTAAPVTPWLGGIEIIHSHDRDRLFELDGTQGRHYYHYTIDGDAQVLHLRNKNPHYPDDRFDVRYERPDADTIVLSGSTSEGDSLSVVLGRLDKKYLLEEARKSGRRGGLVL